MKKILNNTTTDENNCWIWQKSCSSSGYGQFTKDKVYWNTHRYVWEKVNGEIPEGKVIRHLCHVRNCCNPEHLEVGSYKENYNDSRKVHNAANKLKRLKWIIQGKQYKTAREAVLRTGISMSSVIKYTNSDTRVFDVDLYRKSAKIAGWQPKI